MIKMITKRDLNIYASEKHYFLEIENKEYSIFRCFNSLKELISHLSLYPLENKEQIIREVYINERRF
jgi:hypothetical protein